MPSLILPRRFYSQPSTPLQPATEWLDRRLAFAWCAANPRRDVVTGALAETDNTSATSDEHGPAIDCATGQVNIEWQREFLSTSDGAGTGDFTMLVLANPAATAAPQHILAHKKAGASTVNQAILGSNASSSFSASSGSFCFFTFDGATTAISVGSVVDGSYHMWVGRRLGTEVRLFKDGIAIGSTSNTVRDLVSSEARHTSIGSRGNGSTVDAYPDKVVFAAMFDSALLADEIAAISDNPWQIFCAEPRRVYFDLGAGGSAISASGGITTTGTATTSVAYALSAIGVSTSGGSAAQSVAVDLAAAGITVTGGSADLSSSGSGDLAASGGSTSGGSAAPSASVTIAAAGLVESAGLAGLSADVLIAAAGAALSSGNAELATAALLSAAGSAESSGNATWAAQIAAVAAGTVTTGGIATLSGGAPGELNASGGASSGGAAALDITVTLQASGGSQAGGSGTITATVTLTAAGLVQTVGQGAIVINIDLAAFGGAQTSGSATAQVTNSNYPAARLPSFLCIDRVESFLVVHETPTFLTIH